MIRSKLKPILDQRGISIRQLAKDIDYRFDSVRAFYNDQTERYPRELLDKLCTYLGVNIGDLLEYQDDGVQDPPVD
ncbi:MULTISPECIES: helix-turn-helix domain-containing protein [Paenibacillus]|uniref:XRE family transcriptional regulator n=2 Tax=Paenibacillus TaxID=44249 RepID=A0A2T6FZ89_9BACL|nr:MULTISPECIES: helix-turn-helix transcriptional regulator [Paenibacillus]PUA37232.1 XRE family transcriptional regulator [Paenibacillus elgii]GLI07653.1 hypothetical protein YDYSG_36830 [Paenibacillus tyrfis]